MSNKMLPSGISVRIREDLIDGASRTQTTLIVDPIVTLSGHRLTMADIGDIGYGKIDGGNSREEIISWTGITDNTNTYTLTGCTWGINFHNLSSDTANRKRHTSGAKFEIKTDMHYIAGEFRDNADNVFTNTDPMEFQGNEILLGDGTSDNDKVIKADNGDANEPFVKYNETTGKWEISNDGVNSYDPEQGGSGVTAGDAISIVGGAVNFKPDNTRGITIVSDVAGIDLDTDPALEFNSGKLKAKVKSGENILITADGLAADYGTDANKLLRLDASAKLPAVDGSQLTNLPQQTNFQIATTLSYLNYVIQGHKIPSAADSDGNLFIGTYNPSSSYNALLLHRFQKDTTTGLYHKTHTIHSAVSGNGLWGNASFTVLGDYLYVVGNDVGTIRRFDKADLANEIEMTESGFSLGTEPKFIWSDGTYLYVYARTGSYPIYKLSVSGTTATLDSTLITSIQNFYGGSWQDDTNFYAGSNDGVSIINKTTGAVTGSSAVIPLVGIEPSVFGCNLRVGDKIVNISLSNVDSNSQYARPVFSWYSSSEF